MGSRRKVAVLVPSIRPDTWGNLRENLAETAPSATVYILDSEYGSYAEAINEGWKHCDERWLFLGADDLRFCPEWLDEALAKMVDGVKVVGTNDLHNPYVLTGHHATHYLVDRRYIEQVGGVIDGGPGSFLYPYDHGYTDSEFIETARVRGVFTVALDSVVEHLHPDFDNREPDEVDKRTRRDSSGDYETFIKRREMWIDDLDHVCEYKPPPREEDQ